MTALENLIVAFTDEAGSRGYVRKLTDSSDHKISLLCSLLIPGEHVETVRALFKGPFDKFCSAMPDDAKCHITDAFEPGREAWRAVAEAVRADVFRIMKDNGVFLTYSAQRLRIPRETHDLLENLKAEAKKNSRSDFVVRNSNRPSASQVDDDVMINLALMAEAFAEKFERELVDFHFDEIDKAVADRYDAAIATTQNLENFEKEVEARNRKTGETATKKVKISVPLQGLNTKALGKIVIAGKLDPIIFATDVVTNSLWRHLQGLPPDAPLNELSSIKGWECPEITFVAPGDSMFDKI